MVNRVKVLKVLWSNLKKRDKIQDPHLVYQRQTRKVNFQLMKNRISNLMTLVIIRVNKKLLSSRKNKQSHCKA